MSVEDNIQNYTLHVLFATMQLNIEQCILYITCIYGYHGHIYLGGKQQQQ